MDERTNESRRAQTQGRFDLNALAAWALCLGLILLLGLQGDGFPITDFGPVGVAAWWIVALGLLLGFLPRSRPDWTTWTSLALLGAFLAWVALGLTWTDSADKTLVELARTSTYLSVFGLALFGLKRNQGRHVVAATACAVAIIALVALLSRYFPTLFSGSNETGRILTSEADRLSFPLSYWNGLGALLAIGIPLMLQTAAGAKRIVVKCLASASLPVLMLALYLTLSRGGLIAAGLAVVVYLAFSYNRLPKFATLIPALAGSLFLVNSATGKAAFEEGLKSDAARNQGGEMLVLTIIVCALVGAIQFALMKFLADERRPEWTRIGPRPAAIICAAGATLLIVAGLAAGGPDRASDAWSGFKSPESPTKGSERLSASNGNGRYQYWSAAIEEFRSEPVTGTGSGTFEYWWSKNGDRDGFVRDAHSLYAQTLGETGFVGFALLVGFLLSIIATGIYRTTRNRNETGSWLAAALGGCSALIFTAGFDWVWQIPVIVLTFLILGSTFFTLGSDRPETVKGRMNIPLRIVLAVFAAAAAIAILVPWSSTILLDASRSEARAGNRAEAIDAARTARWLSPTTSAPLLQEAQLLELDGQPEAAIATAKAAAENDPANWRTWLLLSGIQLRAGEDKASVASYRKARDLNPRSTIFDH